MITENDSRLLDYLIEESRAGRVKWESTATEDHFATSLKGKYTITVSRYRNQYYRLTMEDAKLTELLNLRGTDDDRVEVLFEIVRRAALDVDAAIAEILSDRDSDDDEKPF